MMIRTMLVVGAMMVLGGCSAGQAPAPSGEPTGEAVAADVPWNPSCPSGFHACSLGTVGYACDDTSWYYCAPPDAGCVAPEPCVPLPPKDAGIDALEAWLARQ